MRIAKFSAVCKFEIGDKICLECSDEEREITDIATTHFVKSNKTIFSFELDNNGRYLKLTEGEAGGNDGTGN